MKPSEIQRLEEIVSSLAIKQFDTQEEYRDVIKMIFYHFFDQEKENINDPDCEI